MSNLCKTYKKGKLVSIFWVEELFYRQIKTLEKYACPREIIELFRSQKDLVIKRASEMPFAEENIPFIPVIPRIYRSPYDLMAMVCNNNKKGYTYLNPTAITDEFDTPKDPYYIYDVDDGESLRRKDIKKATDTIKKQSRLPLTAAEIMAFMTHTNVPRRYGVVALGSRYEGPYKIVGIVLDDGDRPKLGCGKLDSPDDRYWPASCGSRYRQD